ncbi:DEAD/DEAH box helicase family protein [Streptomyces sp. NPDC057939]|uniref:DEAD/DEAH box helicase family protein n=1 Tax=Streptomyces sp. NPDC057939 TaxID=3346284 RepID=UPI0036E3663B
MHVAVYDPEKPATRSLTGFSPPLRFSGVLNSEVWWRRASSSQEEAVTEIVRGLDIPPGKRIPEAGLRATVVACGTGKTFIAAAAALRLARNGRALVLLPALDLLTQTAARGATTSCPASPCAARTSSAGSHCNTGSLY